MGKNQPHFSGKGLKYADCTEVKQKFSASNPAKPIHNVGSKGADLGVFSFTPENKFFESYVVDGFPRYNDTEAKILEDIASKIKDPNISGMEELSYESIKEMLVEDYSDFIKVESYTIEQAIAALLEDSIMMVKNNINNYISVIVALTVISLESNIIPNYILERFIHLSNSVLESYKYSHTSEFTSNMTYINKRLEKEDFDVIEDQYKKRVDLLLESN